RSLLAAGLQLIDTPPLPGLAAGETAGETAALARVRDLVTAGQADVLLFACEAGRELTGAEIAVLADLSLLLPGLVVAFTKTDYAPDWRRDIEANRMRLVQAGVRATVLATSAALRVHATRTGDSTLNGESGFPQLIAHLRTLLAAKPDRLSPAAVGLLGRTVTDELAV